MIAQTTFGAQEWLEFLGRLHPLVLHLPIGLFAGAVLVELTTFFSPSARPARRVVHLALGASAAAAALTGWLLAGDGSGFPSELLEEHRVLALIAAGCAVLAAACEVFGRARAAGSMRVVLLLACGAALGAAGHRGGMMTHGQRFLSEKAPGWLAPYVGPRPRERRAVDEAVETVEGNEASPGDQPPVDEGPADPEPVSEAQAEAPEAGAAAGVSYLVAAMRESCFECHCEAKVKGNLRLDLVEGWTGAVDLEDLEFSELLYRVTLPADDPDVMPPDGEKLLDAKAVAELRLWIEQGADPAVIEAALASGG